MRTLVIGATLLVASCQAQPVYALDVIEVVQPATCQVNSMPMPCAFMLALVQKMRERCAGRGCSGQTTCAVKP